MIEIGEQPGDEAGELFVELSDDMPESMLPIGLLNLKKNLRFILAIKRTLNCSEKII